MRLYRLRLADMFPSPQKEPSPKNSSGLATRARNRQIFETPVVVSDGSVSDIAATPQLSRGEPIEATVAAASRGSEPISDKLDPA